MVAHLLTFDNLIHPITYKDFITHYWEKKPIILTKSGRDGFQKLINLDNIHSLLFSIAQHPKSSSPRVLLCKRTPFPQKIEPSLNPETGLLNKNKLIEAYKSGSSIVMYYQEDFFPPLAALCGELENILGHPTHSSIFLTPPHADGFQPHYDKFDTFVLQIEGKKLWKIYEEAILLPLVSNANPFIGKSIPACQEVELEPGDFLYLPRGYVHETATTSSHSLHVTLATEVFTWADLFYEMMKKEPELRKGLPVEAMLSKHAQKVDPHFMKKAEEALANREYLRYGFSKLHSKFVKTKKTSRAKDFKLHDSLPPLTDNTLLRKKEGISCSLVEEYDRSILYFGSEELAGPTNITSTLQHILDHDHFSVQTLPNTLSSSSNMLLVKTLLKEGFLVIAETP